MADTSAYTPPIEDYAFLWRAAFGVDIVARATAGAVSADDATDVLAAAGEFAAEVLAPLNHTGDRAGIALVDGRARTPDGFREAYASLVEQGWISAEAPESAGGEGLPGVVRAGLGEIWNAANPAFALCGMLTAGAIRAVDAVASDELRSTYLTRMVSGEWTGTMNLTEPQAGTDLGAIRTLATPRGDGSWAITGQKIFITWGDHDVAENIVHLVLARTPDAPAGARGLSLFLAPTVLVGADGSLGERNTIRTLSVEHKLGIHASPTCVLEYADAIGYLLGELHGGLAGMFVMMNDARIGMGLQATGIADRAYQRARAYAHERRQGSVVGRGPEAPIAEHPDVRRLLLSMASEISAMRALGVWVGDLFDRADDADGIRLAELFVPIFKGWATEEAQRLTSDAIQVHGGMGFIEESGAPQHYRDARIMPIYEGTTAIQANDLIGRKVLRDGAATLARVLTGVAESAAALGRIEHPVARRLAERLERARQEAERATAALLSFNGSPRDAYAASVPYLLLLGLLSGGWMHALMLQAALAGGGSPDATARRVREADAYGIYHLSRVAGLADIVAAGEVGD